MCASACTRTNTSCFNYIEYKPGLLRVNAEAHTHKHLSLLHRRTQKHTITSLPAGLHCGGCCDWCLWPILGADSHIGNLITLSSSLLYLVEQNTPQHTSSNTQRTDTCVLRHKITTRAGSPWLFPTKPKVLLQQKVAMWSNWKKHLTHAPLTSKNRVGAPDCIPWPLTASSCRQSSRLADRSCAN